MKINLARLLAQPSTAAAHGHHTSIKSLAHKSQATMIATSLGVALVLTTNAFGASFNVTGNDTAAKSLSAGQTGTVTGTGDLNVSGSTATVAVTGNASITVNAGGKIRQTGTGRTIDANTVGVTLTLDNSGTISSVGANESIRMAQTATLNLTNQLGASITSATADAVRPGNNSVITNLGTISAASSNIASPPGSDGIDLRTERTGIVVHNSGSISGRHGIATDGANVGPSSITVDNQTGGVIFALNGSGLNVDADTSLPSAVNVTANVTNAAGATIKGGVFSNSTDGDGDGIDIDGVLTLNNSGDVLALGSKNGSNPEGIAAGGGSITNNATGQIIGSSLAADAPNGDPTAIGSGILIDDSNGGNAVAATTVINSGLIRGKSGFGIKIIGNFADSITNNAAGTIRGAGTGAAILTGGGADSLTNRGTITSDIGNAVDLEGGDDSFTIDAGGATVTGNVSGGTGTNTATFDPGAAQSFSYANSLSNFSTVEVKSGIVTLTGMNAYTGTTKVTGGVLKLDGANRVSSSSPLNLNGGTLEVDNAGGPSGQTFASLILSNNSTLDLDLETSLTFNALGAITAGKTLSVVDYLESLSPTYAYRVLGNQTGNASFLSLVGATTINGLPATFNFDGTYSNVVLAPEPSSLATGVGMICLVMSRRRRA